MMAIISRERKKGNGQRKLMPGQSEPHLPRLEVRKVSGREIIRNRYLELRVEVEEE